MTPKIQSSYNVHIHILTYLCETGIHILTYLCETGISHIDKVTYQMGVRVHF